MCYNERMDNKNFEYPLADDTPETQSYRMIEETMLGRTPSEEDIAFGYIADSLTPWEARLVTEVMADIILTRRIMEGGPLTPEESDFYFGSDE